MTGPAEEWASRQQAGAPLRWKQLELAAYAEHPDVQVALDPARAKVGPGVLLMGLLSGVLWLAPVLGFAWLVNGRYGPFEPAVRVYGGAAWFTLASLGQVLWLAGWWRSGRQRGRGVPLQSWTTLVLGAASVPAMAAAGRDVSGWVPYAVPVALAALLALAVLLLERLASVPAPDPEPRALARRAVAELTEPQRAAVRRDLEAALQDLGTRGLVSDVELRRARDADLGLLTVAVSRRDG